MDDILEAPAPPQVTTSATDSKTAQMAARHVTPEKGSRLLERFGQLRAVLRDETMRQSGAQSSTTERDDPQLASIFFLHGEAHKRRRGAIIGFFTPKAIATRHMPIIAESADRLVGEFRRSGRARLDQLVFRLTVAVTAEIVGLTETDRDALSRRVERFGSAPVLAGRGGLWRLLAGALARASALHIYLRDVKPAIAARRRQRRDDVISRLLDEGRSDQEILAESLTFGLAGMTTTREFLVAAAWHLLENQALRERFLAEQDDGKTAILMEILRLEPVAGMIYRSASTDVASVEAGAIAAGARLSLSIRAANLDDAEVGPEPARLDPDRAKKLRVNGAYMSFGDGAHFCPGWQVALVQSRVFLDRLLRAPGVRLVQPPRITWVPPMLQMYELRDAIIACDR
jgi:cytochrome P450